jgi:hypothetical protein
MKLIKKKVVEAHAIENAHAQKAGKPLPSLAPVATPSAAVPAKKTFKAIPSPPTNKNAIVGEALPAKDSPAAPPAAAAPVAAKDSPPAKPPKALMVPLQIRIAAAEAKAIKHAAIEADQTISDFMLACFYAYMKK